MAMKILKISEAATIALHTTVLLATDSKKPLFTKEIASQLEVSEAHLSKVLQRLTKMGLVKSTRGPKGGFVLGKNSQDITLLNVYEALEGPLTPSNCLLGNPICDGNNCILSDLINKVDNQIRTYLSSTNLASLVKVFKSR